MKDFKQVEIEEKNILVEPGTMLSEVFEQNNIKVDYQCSGNGTCGKCKVKIIGNNPSITKEEKSLLSKDEIKEGIRLACLTKIDCDCKIEIVHESQNYNILEEGYKEICVEDPLFKKYGIAVDIGSTTLVVSLYDKNKKIGQVSSRNPQSLYGSDVMSRIQCSINGKKEDLKNIIVDEINDLIYEMCKKTNIENYDIDGVVITGNTAMLYFLTERDVNSMAHFPFEVEHLFDEFVLSKQIGLNLDKHVNVYIPECISAFLGADIVTSIIYSNLIVEGEKNLIVDIGTNGEMALWDGSKLLGCSTAAGPAFEGAELTSGVRGIDGAINKFYIEDEKLEYTTINNYEAIGICGSGVIDLIKAFKDLGIIDSTGKFFSEDEFIIKNDKKYYKITSDVYFSQEDIRKVQLAKAAINGGIKTLLNYGDIKCSDIDNFYISGGFGSFINIKNAAEIGLIPKELLSKAKVIGNSALSGAEEILCNYNKLKELKFNNMDVIDLASSKEFMDNYIDSMKI